MGVATCSEWYMPYDFCVDILIQNKEVLFLLCQDIFLCHEYVLFGQKHHLYNYYYIIEIFFYPFNKELD